MERYRRGVVIYNLVPIVACTIMVADDRNVCMLDSSWGVTWWSRRLPIKMKTAEGSAGYTGASHALGNEM